MERAEVAAARVLIGGVGYRWFGDASFGLVTSDELAGLDWPEGVDVEDLGYGALHVALDLLETRARYDRVILIAVSERGREPGRLYRFDCDAPTADDKEVQDRMYEAGAGVIDLDHLVVIGRHFGALPDHVVAIELEPHPGTMGDVLSSQVQALVPKAIDLVRREVLAAAPLSGI
ncbi:MAG: hydrogenase maturation protease [Actinobacteria bacterium]|nr:hydrogenase maturation protease [Actinomycetota bacterium]MBW3650797.1 hydrogenase maturation protease [Actinomycetota bacterium]